MSRKSLLDECQLEKPMSFFGCETSRAACGYCGSSNCLLVAADCCSLREGKLMRKHSRFELLSASDALLARLVVRWQRLLAKTASQSWASPNDPHVKTIVPDSEKQCFWHARFLVNVAVSVFGVGFLVTRGKRLATSSSRLKQIFASSSHWKPLQLQISVQNADSLNGMQ